MSISSHSQSDAPEASQYYRPQEPAIGQAYGSVSACNFATFHICIQSISGLVPSEYQLAEIVPTYHHQGRGIQEQNFCCKTTVCSSKHQTYRDFAPKAPMGMFSSDIGHAVSKRHLLNAVVLKFID